ERRTVSGAAANLQRSGLTLPGKGEGAGHPLVLPSALPFDGVALDLALEVRGGGRTVVLTLASEAQLAVLEPEILDRGHLVAVGAFSFEGRPVLGDGQDRLMGLAIPRLVLQLPLADDGVSVRGLRYRGEHACDDDQDERPFRKADAGHVRTPLQERDAGNHSA